MLFLAGLFGWFIINVNTLKEDVRENVPLRIFLKEDAQQKDVNHLEKYLQQKPSVKKVVYVSKEEGLKSMQEELGLNAEELLGYNPLPNSIDVNFNSDFIQADSLLALKSNLENNVAVREVFYNKILVQDIDKNIRIVGIILLSLALLMGAVSIALINNTIRLTLYSKRFIIKSMQLVGATQNFIRKPFIIKGFIIGLCSSVFACALMLLTLYIFTRYFPYLNVLHNYTQLSLLFLGIILLGIIISSLSSFFAINKYLKMKLDDLF